MKRNLLGQYEKEIIPWNKGKLHSKATREKISKACRGRIPWNKGRFGIFSHTEETKKKIGDAERGKKNHNWKGGKRIEKGYLFILKPDHPYANNQGYIQEHKLVAEKALGRYLKPGEIIHHVNGDSSDNRNCNLLICTQSYHQWLHGKMSHLYMQEHFGG